MLVELGSGTSDKTRLLLDAMAQPRAPARVRAVRRQRGDVAPRAAEDITDDLRRPGARDRRRLPPASRRRSREEERRLVAFLGSTIGNLDPAQRRRFLFDLDTTLDYDDWLLLGTDLVKDRARLVAAYNDAAGVTAAFNRNVLAVLNRELGAHFDLDTFDHVAVWDEDERWIEMRLRSHDDQIVAIDDLALKVQFDAGEEMRTEIAAKFTAEQVQRELWDSGFVVEATWTDPAGDFLLTLAHPYC